MGAALNPFCRTLVGFLQFQTFSSLKGGGGPGLGWTKNNP